MKYEKEIIQILREVGPKGMPLRRIALNVFNMTNSLFEPKDRAEVLKDVGIYLRTTSQQSGSMVEKTDTRGWYRLNLNSKQVQQLLLQFEVPEDMQYCL